MEKSPDKYTGKISDDNLRFIESMGIRLKYIAEECAKRDIDFMLTLGAISYVNVNIPYLTNQSWKILNESIGGLGPCFERSVLSNVCEALATLHREQPLLFKELIARYYRTGDYEAVAGTIAKSSIDESVKDNGKWKDEPPAAMVPA